MKLGQVLGACFSIIPNYVLCACLHFISTEEKSQRAPAIFYAIEYVFPGNTMCSSSFLICYYKRELQMISLQYVVVQVCIFLQIPSCYS